MLHGAGICTPTFTRTKSPSYVGQYTSTVVRMWVWYFDPCGYGTWWFSHPPHPPHPPCSTGVQRRSRSSSLELQTSKLTSRSRKKLLSRHVNSNGLMGRLRLICPLEGYNFLDSVAWEMSPFSMRGRRHGSSWLIFHGGTKPRECMAIPCRLWDSDGLRPLDCTTDPYKLRNTQIYNDLPSGKLT